MVLIDKMPLITDFNNFSLQLERGVSPSVIATGMGHNAGPGA